MHKVLPYRKVKNLLTQAEKVGQLFMPAAFINDSEEEVKQLENLIRNYHIGAICFFHSRASAATNFEKNLPSVQKENKVQVNKNSLQRLKELIKRYQNAATHPLLIGIDAEWGLAMRIENTPQYPYAITLGAIKGHNKLIYKLGKNIGRDCRHAGIHWNLAPVVDLNNNPNNPVIGYRSFGEGKKSVTKKAIAYIEGARSEGIISCLKHFPGHGDTATDSHLGLPLIAKPEKQLFKNELYPFKKIIKNGVDSVMIGHLAVPGLSGDKTLPATLSNKIIKGVLRKKLNFKGVVISDALNMHSVSQLFSTKGEVEWQAFDAGNDFLCFAENTKEGVATIIKKASEPQIEESFKRVWRLKERVFITSAKNKGLPKRPDPLNHKLAKESLTLFRGDLSFIASFRKSGFSGISMGSDTNNIFFRLLSKEYPSHSLSSLSVLRDGKKESENVLLALFPPKVKPENNFGIKTEELQFISESARTKNAILYLFGNPYVLNLIPINDLKGIVIVYQDFEVFQKNAAQHFLGRLRAKGMLPVSINPK